MNNNNENQIYTPVHHDIFNNKKYDYIGCIDSVKGLSLKLINKTDEVCRLKFDSYLFFRVIDESYSFMLFDEFTQYNTHTNPVYIVDNSFLMKWLSNKNYNSWDYSALVHLRFFLDNYILDMITKDPMCISFKGQKFKIDLIKIL